jgi:hypothetical protein
MKRRTRKDLTIALSLALAVLGLLLTAGGAEAATLNLKCQPVAGTLNVTFSNWEPQGNGAYDHHPV